jgi:peptide/nickel transport system permease protein
VLAAVRQGKFADRALGLFSLFGVSLPNFALGPLLILLFSIMLGLLPVSGRDGLSHLILPASTLALGLAAMTMRMVRSSMLDENSSGLRPHCASQGFEGTNGFVQARAEKRSDSGDHRSRVADGIAAGRSDHYGNYFFLARPGPTDNSGHNARDYPLAQGCILTISLTYIFINLLTDLMYSVVDPRIRL